MPKKVRSSPEETQNRILNVAERLFAERGFDGVSARQIAATATVNLAAAHYHFGDMEELYVAAAVRRLRPLNAAHDKLLSAAEADAGGQAVPLEKLVEILVRPVFEAGADPQRGGLAGLQLVGRVMLESKPFVHTLLGTELEPFMLRLYKAIRRNLPQVPPEEFTWRFHFMLGALAHTLVQLRRIEDLSRGLCRTGDVEGAISSFVSFAVAGLRLPAATAVSTSV